jgi:DNA-binding MarR family transcriptional regulator
MFDVIGNNLQRRRIGMTEKEIDGMIEILTGLIPVFTKMIKQVHYELLQNMEISSVHIYILFILNSEGQLNMSTLSKKMMAPKPNVTVFVEKLIELGYIERVYNEKDRRIISVRLTEAGHECISRHIIEIKKYFKNLLSHYDEKDLRLLKTSLENADYFLEKYKNRKEKING